MFFHPYFHCQEISSSSKSEFNDKVPIIGEGKGPENIDSSASTKDSIPIFTDKAAVSEDSIPIEVQTSTQEAVNVVKIATTEAAPIERSTGILDLITDMIFDIFTPGGNKFDIDGKTSPKYFKDTTQKTISSKDDSSTLQNLDKFGLTSPDFSLGGATVSPVGGANPSTPIVGGDLGVEGGALTARFMFMLCDVSQEKCTDVTFDMTSVEGPYRCRVTAVEVSKWITLYLISLDQTIKVFRFFAYFL